MKKHNHFYTEQTTGQDIDLWSVAICYVVGKMSPVSSVEMMLLCPERVFRSFQHIKQDIGFVLATICENFLRLRVGYLSGNCQLPIQECVSRNLQRVGDADKGFQTHHLCATL